MSAAKLRGYQLSLIPDDADLAVSSLTSSPTFQQIKRLSIEQPFDVGDRVVLTGYGEPDFYPFAKIGTVVKAWKPKRRHEINSKNRIFMGAWKCKVKFIDDTRILWDRQIRKV